ncbi:rRNA-processing protein bfr2 [Knufia obscura]|uniref:Protein BFR2 n=2 Tax=Knufia TaxID=430999 RepID=A0AAN8E982_9EURO|nr:rRNA-processing protein bfr2 [Knufia obscura]KAK5948783.1 rRNA-processing protein bfr2 [Knufia fluminis]
MSKLRKDVEALTLGKKKPRDYDPEDERDEDGEESGSGSEEEGTTGGREHYERVGKSKLRRPEVAPLDPKYGGAVVSRAALAGEASDEDLFAPPDDDEDEDPFAVARDTRDGVSDDDEDEDHVSFGEDYEDNDDAPNSEVGPDDDMESSSEVEDEEDEEDDIDGDEEDEEEDTEGGRSGPGMLNGTATSKDRAEIRAQLASTSQNLASGLSKAANDDVKKGQAVKKQYQTFDRLLDARMKLQKGLTASDNLAAQQSSTSFTTDADEALREAQDAALQLFNTIGSFRESITSAAGTDSASKKRKRTLPVDNPNSLDSIWKSLEELEAESRSARHTTIDRWSAKAKLSDPGRNAANTRSKFLDPSSRDDRLTTVLDTFVINEQEKHFRGQDHEDEEDGDSALKPTMPAYDDSMFYQSLLRDLITARSAASANDISTSMLPPKLHVSGNKQNKRTIDTKASKGRKIRYTVHDKLQNFMASEGDTGRDTAMWTERGKNEFFGSLFGQDRVLRENDDDEDMVDGDDMIDDGAEVEALRLFRT